MSPDDVQKIADYCDHKLYLTHIQRSKGYEYPYLALCIIDAVFSIGTKYISTQNTVRRFSECIGNPDHFSLQQMISLYEQETVEGMAVRIYKNKQRTSTKNGILKADAVLRVTKLLHHYETETFQDMQNLSDNPNFEAEFKQIPGQKSGISLFYLHMLAGNENVIKPDRMINRFIATILQRKVSMKECIPLIVQTCELLKTKYPHLTPRDLDHEIWKYQREQ